MEINDDVVFSSLDEYKAYFKAIFTIDSKFSQKFKKEIDQIILRNLVEIRDHETQPSESDRLKDLSGFDRTIKVAPTTMGRRIRRECWISKAEFTMDTKEWASPTQPQYYIFGYGNETTHHLSFYILWNHKEFMSLAKKNAIKHGMEKNKRHSRVQFLTFSLKKIFDKCHILDFGGTPEAIRMVLGNNPKKPNRKLGEFA